MNGLPEGWEATVFGEVFDFKGGSQPPKSTFFHEPGEGRIRLLQIRDFESDDKAVYIEDNGKWPRCEINDVMVGRYGASVGKVLSGKAGAYNVALVKWLFDHDLLDRDWVERLLRSGLFQEPLAMLSRSAQNGFNKGDVEKFPLALPPLAEQRRIVSRLDQLSARTRAAKDRLTHVQTLATRAKQATLAAETVAPWNEMNATTSRVVDLLETSFDGPFGSKLKTQDYTENGRRVVRLENIGHLSFRMEKESFVSEAKFTELSRHLLYADDVLFSSFVDSEIRVCRVPEELHQAAINKADCFCLRVNQSKVLPKFLEFRLAAPDTYLDFVKLVHGATRPRVGLKHLKVYEILLPDIEQQTEIVRRIEAAFARIDRMVADAAKALALLERLEQQLLAKAFRGELVPQDPSDEPASALLARIREARANAPKPKRARKKKGAS